MKFHIGDVCTHRCSYKFNIAAKQKKIVTSTSEEGVFLFLYKLKKMQLNAFLINDLLFGHLFVDGHSNDWLYRPIDYEYALFVELVRALSQRQELKNLFLVEALVLIKSLHLWRQRILKTSA